MKQNFNQSKNVANVTNAFAKLNEALKAYSEALKNIKGSVSDFYTMSQDCNKCKL